MSAKFPCVSKWPIVPGIIDLPKFNYEDLEEILAGGQGSFEFIGNASRCIHTHYAPTPLLLLFIPYKFLVRMMIKFRMTKEKEKQEDTIK